MFLFQNTPKSTRLLNIFKAQFRNGCENQINNIFIYLNFHENPCLIAAPFMKRALPQHLLDIYTWEIFFHSR